jgi:uncharacterized protein (UPF0210 family)
MKIRSITFFDNPGYPLGKFHVNAEVFITKAKEIFLSNKVKVQSVRYATPPFAELLPDLSEKEFLSYAVELEQILSKIGYDYISLGPALPELPMSYSIIPKVIQNTEITFCSGLMTHPEKGLSLPAVRSCGQVIHRLAKLDPNGFDNLYFAALGNVPPGTPYFPAAYHHDGEASFSIAVEAADLAVSAFSGSSSFPDAQTELIHLIEEYGNKIGALAEELAKYTGSSFDGIDYSLAPFPDDSCSLGNALEETGIQSLGDQGSLAAAAFLAHTIDKAKFHRIGFSGLMLPVLEDSVLARRAGEGSLTIKDMLLYSTVCGTGLDTIPLPGDASSQQLSALLFDLGALSLRLDKPLTARLMPLMRYYAYVEITPRQHQSLWYAYQDVKAVHAHFAMQEIGGADDIYPVFRELFKRQEV